MLESQFKCPLFAIENPLAVKCKGAEYIPAISVVAPSGIETRKVNYWEGNVPTNRAGGIGLTIDLHITPLDVSFEGIAVEEVPCTEGTHSGYFSFPRFSGEWCHSRDNGAGKWIKVSEENLFGQDFACLSNEMFRVTEDGIFVEDESGSWIDGKLIWQVPFGWNELGTEKGTPEFARFAEDTKQTMVIFPNEHCGVEKFGNRASRYIDGRIYLNGRQVK